MKILFILIILLIGIFNSNGDTKKLEFISTFPEGFGVLIKRDLLLEKVIINSKHSGGFERIYVVVNTEEKKEMILLQGSEAILTNLNSKFGSNNLLKATCIGYESLLALGRPGLSESVKDEDVELPGTYGWNVVKSFKIYSFTLIDESEKDSIHK